jgi:hypothetical protein
MMNIANLGRRMAQSLSLAAAAVLVMSTTQYAQALSPVSPATSLISKAASEAPITQVHGPGGGGGHGGGGGMHGGGGGMHGGGGGMHIGGGGMHIGGGAMHGGGGGMHIGGSGMHAVTGGGFHHPGGHFIFAHHHHHHHFGRGFYGYGYDDYPAYYYYPRRCPIVWTHYGPRRICHYHRWHHYRHHHHRRHHWY